MIPARDQRINRRNAGGSSLRAPVIDQMPVSARAMVVLSLGVLWFPCLSAAQLGTPVDFGDSLAVSDQEFPKEISPRQAELIRERVAQLGSPIFEYRNDATKQLLNVGVAALPTLQRAYRGTDDLETKLRIEGIVREAYIDYHVFDRNGFLGVSLRPYWLAQHGAIDVPEGTVGVVVTNVVEGSGAGRAGLLENDVIVSLDGHPIDGTRGQLVQAFAATVRSHRPGTDLRIGLWRKGRERLIIATVGRAARTSVRRGNIQVIPRLLREAEARFPTWWTAHFESAPIDRTDQ